MERLSAGRVARHSAGRCRILDSRRTADWGVDRDPAPRRTGRGTGSVPIGSRSATGWRPARRREDGEAAVPGLGAAADPPASRPAGGKPP